MSADSDNKSPLAELDLDLHFLPAWAQQPADANRYAKYTGNEESGGGRRGGGGRGFGDRGPRRDFNRGPRPQGQGGGGGGGGGFRPEGQRGPRPGGFGGGQGGDRR